MIFFSEGIFFQDVFSLENFPCSVSFFFVFLESYKHLDELEQKLMKINKQKPHISNHFKTGK